MKAFPLLASMGLSVLMVATLAASAFAGPRGEVVNHRQHRQDQRIMQGVRSGELTRPEAHRLLQGQRRVNRYERLARRDGQISLQEARRLDRMQDRQSDRIYHQKHDAQDRGF